MRRLLRILLPAVFLAVLQAPMALGQGEQAELYAYHQVYSSGSVVFAYVTTDIAYPPYTNRCDFGWGNNCWEMYTSYAQVDLWWENDWMGGYSSALWDTGVTAWMAVDAWPGVWTLEATHFVEDLYYRDAYGFQWHEPWMPDYQWEDLTINPEITLSGPQSVGDGDVGYFSVSAQGGTPTSYYWSPDYPIDAGNSPHVNFDDPYASSTLTDAHWYALPDDACWAQVDSAYTITAYVGFGETQVRADTWLEVTAGPSKPGETAAPGWGGHPTQWAQVGGMWRVTQVDNPYTRGSPQRYIHIPESNQFYSKIVGHEDFHMSQWGPGGYLVNHNVMDVEVLWNRVKGLVGFEEADLIEAIAYEELAWWFEQLNLVEYYRSAAEWEAYNYSDGLSPMYLYHNCNRFQWYP